MRSVLLCAGFTFCSAFVGCGGEECTPCHGGGCYDLSSDANHCGSCDRKCAAGQVCSDGQCRASSGSCPFVFLEEEGTYRYHGDLSGSPLAKGLSFFRPQYYGLNVYELGDWAADQGRFRMRLRELAFEASFVDQVELVLVDVPAGYTAYNEWSSTPQLDREPSRKYVTVQKLRPPLTATTDSGRNVLAQISKADGVPLPVENQLSRVVVDFGPVEHPERARLVVTTWGAYADWRDQLLPPYSAGTLVETLDASGTWQRRVLAGKSAADAKSWVLDVADVLRRDDGRMRITLAHQQSTLDLLDAVGLDDSEPVPYQLTRISPTIAMLAFGGASPFEAPTVDHRAIVGSTIIPPATKAFLSGSYTRYGDVRALLQKAEDKFVLTAHADELYLEFVAPQQAPGTARRAFLEADLFYTLKYHPFGQLTDTVDPLPFHGMQSYPYPSEQWPYREDADYQRYLREWNTRTIVASPGL
jgi:hypothetical protein